MVPQLATVLSPSPWVKVTNVVASLPPNLMSHSYLSFLRASMRSCISGGNTELQLDIQHSKQQVKEKGSLEGGFL